MTQLHGLQIEFRGKHPQVHPTAYIAPSAVLIGDVTVGPESSIWFGAVLRADYAPIIIGADANLQDNCTVHVGEGGGVLVEDGVTVGHGAIIHNCTIRHGALIGMGAVILDYAEVGADALVAAGAVVTERMVVSAGHLVRGVPAQDAGSLTERTRSYVTQSALSYRELSREFRASFGS